MTHVRGLEFFGTSSFDFSCFRAILKKTKLIVGCGGQCREENEGKEEGLGHIGGLTCYTAS